MKFAIGHFDAEVTYIDCKVLKPNVDEITHKKKSTVEIKDINTINDLLSLGNGKTVLVIYPEGLPAGSYSDALFIRPNKEESEENENA